jgi:adenosylmethionine-8-amino-7-oxononanoate aminotransferase
MSRAMSTDLTEPQSETTSEPRDLQGLARRHLWMHFTRMGGDADSEIPIIVRGEGCYVYDEHGKRYLDGHPVAAAVALANLDIIEREDLCANVRANETSFRAMLEELRHLEIVGDVRGAGYFHAIELVKDRETRERFDDEESEALLRGFLSPELYRRGLICRTDDRGDPVIQLSPPLIAGQEQFDEIEAILRPVLTEAWERISNR